VQHIIVSETMSDGTVRYCARIALEGHGVVQTRWYESRTEAKREAMSGHVKYVGVIKFSDAC